ncbi:MAG: arsenite methyltransferase [Candidatus Bathyarchaeota archaeon]|nr:MAG: arsenite methyltransferase [Candidatus Bathyarchaeota archaeon]
MEEAERKRREVREGYAKIATEGLCCSPTTSCIDSPMAHEELGKKMGYTGKELESVPEGANLGLGCGNPVALASLKEGETVVDLGSGAGLDCFLAAKRVGEMGKVIGVDMTPEMVDKARANAKKGDYQNVEFRLGEIENLPIADNTADAIISNCVINLTPNKKRVFKEAFRTLKPKGRLMVSDIVLLKELPETIKNRAHAASCVKGAIMKDKYIEAIKQAGFQDVTIIKEEQYPFEDLANDPDAKIIVANPNKNTQELKRVSELEKEAKEMVKEILASTESVNISATKPAGAV